MKMNLTLFGTLMLIGISIITSCERTTAINENPEIVIVDKDTTEIETPVEPDPIPNTPSTVDITVYTEYPEEIDGCACYFGRTASELSEGKYIFMTNYEKRAYMTLDGEMREFELLSEIDSEKGELLQTWSNKDYTMKVSSNEVGQVDETWQNIGTITITPKGKDATTVDVVGECGC